MRDLPSNRFYAPQDQFGTSKSTVEARERVSQVQPVFLTTVVEICTVDDIMEFWRTCKVNISGILIPGRLNNAVVAVRTGIRIVDGQGRRRLSRSATTT